MNNWNPTTLAIATIAASSFALLALASLAAACGDDATEAATTSDSGVESGVGRVPTTADDADAPTVTCADTCALDHVEGVDKDRAITSCWLANCAVACAVATTPSPVDTGNPFDVDAGPDASASDAGTSDAGASDAGASDAGNDASAGPSCQQPVVTDSDTCDTCTKTYCCAAWDGCFGDPACTALNVCTQACAP